MWRGFGAWTDVTIYVWERIAHFSVKLDCVNKMNQIVFIMVMVLVLIFIIAANGYFLYKKDDPNFMTFIFVEMSTGIFALLLTLKYIWKRYTLP